MKWSIFPYRRQLSPLLHLHLLPLLLQILLVLQVLLLLLLLDRGTLTWLHSRLLLLWRPRSGEGILHGRRRGGPRRAWGCPCGGGAATEASHEQPRGRRRCC